MMVVIGPEDGLSLSVMKKKASALRLQVFIALPYVPKLDVERIGIVCPLGAIDDFRH